MADICVYLAVCHQASWGVEVGVGGILLSPSPSSRWAAQPDPASVPGLLSPEEDALCPAQPPHRPAGSLACGLVAAAGQPRHHLHCQHNTTYQHLPTLHISPPHSPVQYDPPPPFLPELGVSWGSLQPAGTGAAKPKLQMLTETRIYLWWKRKMKHSITYENFGAKNN